MCFYFESELLNRFTAEGHREGAEVRRENLKAKVLSGSPLNSANLCG